MLDPVALSLVARWLLGWVLFWRFPGLGPRSGAPDVRLVSVVVPARDEQDTLPTLLGALAVQTRGPHEVVVVDDDSRDGTADVARRGGARVVTSAPLPQGWTGKAWACWQGASEATGDVLVFLDADTRPATDLLDRLVSAQARRGGLVSVQPYHRMERLTERLSAFFNLIAVMGIGAASAWRRARVTGAFGPCLCAGRGEYFASGGHASVRRTVLEDVALRRSFEEHGIQVAALGAAGAISFRMYPRGLRQLADGWSKNFAAGAGTTPLPRLLAIVAWFSGVLASGRVLVDAFAAAVAGGPAPGAAAWFVYALFAAQLVVMLRPLGNFGVAAAIYPVPALVFVAAFVRSVWWALRGEVEWKGRTISVRRTAAP